MEKEIKNNLLEITMEELVKMVNKNTNEFIIHVELRGESDSDERKGSVQP